MGGSCSIFVPESMVPDCLENEGLIVKVAGVVGWGKKGPYFRVDSVESV